MLIRRWPDDRVTLEAVLPRRTSLLRAGAGERSEGQLLAANATVAAVVVGLVPDPGMAKVERLLAVAWASGARPMLVLTKADMVGDGAELAAELADEAPGVETALVSARSGLGVEQVRAAAGTEGTVVLLGSSGVGSRASSTPWSVRRCSASATSAPTAAVGTRPCAASWSRCPAVAA